mmetsp:Transcript_11591/g.23087  ORF Transcript_11591/g.23087 Transcript_11591/m.23087 type:complete len:339 (+) Transcript_11591:29-1045(+)
MPENFHQPLLKQPPPVPSSLAAASAPPTSMSSPRPTLFSISSRFSSNTPLYPSAYEAYYSSIDGAPVRRRRRRQLFIVLTKPGGSKVGMAFFGVMITIMLTSVAIMTLETMDEFMESPDECDACRGEDEGCVCEPVPKKWLTDVQEVIYYIFTAEYILRHLTFYPAPRKAGGSSQPHAVQFLKFAVHPWQVIDLLAVAPFWLEDWFSNVNSLNSVRVLRLFRVFQVIKLGKYNRTFVTFFRVLKKSFPALNLLFCILFFGMCLFGSLIYEAERGLWTRTTDGSYEFRRPTTAGDATEASPFTSIPQSFWWFIVTATTVGYGDTYPTTPWGKVVGEKSV